MTEKEKNELVKRILAEQTQGAKAQANSNVFQSGKNLRYNDIDKVLRERGVNGRKGNG